MYDYPSAWLCEQSAVAGAIFTISATLESFPDGAAWVGHIWRSRPDGEYPVEVYDGCPCEGAHRTESAALRCAGRGRPEARREFLEWLGR